MKAKLALGFVTAMLASACAGPMTWDDKVFPPQPTYSGAAPGALVAQSTLRYDANETPGN